MTVDHQPASPRPNGGLSQVTVTINGRQFRMACEHGQEAHLRRLATDLDQRIDRLRRNFGDIGNTRLTVMAALILSDELVEIGDKLRAVEHELAALQDARVAAAEHARVTQTAVAAALNAAAARIEGITRKINRTRPPEEPPPPAQERVVQEQVGKAGPMRLAGAPGSVAAVPNQATKSDEPGEKLVAKELADAELADEELDDAEADADADEEVDEDTDEDSDEYADDDDEVDEDDDEDDQDDEEEDEDADEKPAPKSKPVPKK